MFSTSWKKWRSKKEEYFIFDEKKLSVFSISKTISMLQFSAVSFSESVVELIVENKMEGCFLPAKCRKLVGSKAKKIGSSRLLTS